ncbi:Tautomerase/MIF superfamily [Mycena alexandri]|uniref:L-dopachrome isomerase n=1 Tax=Mycena alexandri TaxID=1745969 RepID=A0AAD6X8H8_9AGAR|nr:Tautomerase/MIF superfamily [Mycena alexandri]
MPYLQFMVNIQVPNETEFALELSKHGAKTLNKPDALMSVSVTYNKTLTFAGTLEPAFALTVISLDNLNTEENERYSVAFSKFIEEKLNIPSDRGYITFQDPGRGFSGFKGTTFATIFA